MHVDAAYGGYFGLIAEELDEPARRAYAAIGQADSIVIDPHKHGLQPTDAGACCFAIRRWGGSTSTIRRTRISRRRSLHLGEISLECSRAGAAAVALWATQRLLPLKPGGSLRRGWRRGGARRWNWTGGCARMRGSSGLPNPIPGLRSETWGTRRNWTSWSGHCIACSRLSDGFRAGAKVFDACAGADCIWL